MLQLIKKANNFQAHNSIPFTYQQQLIGFVRKKDVLPHLNKYPQVFSVTSDQVTFHQNLQTEKDRSEALNSVLLNWRENGILEQTLGGWRNELYPVYARTDRDNELILKVERCAVVLFGFRCFGCHLNGYQYNQKTGEYLMWVSKRSLEKKTYPGYLDNLVGGNLKCLKLGGLPYNVKPFYNIIKEANEEASIPKELAEKAKAAGAISFIHENERGVVAETEFVYDIELPSDFQPKVNDGEVETFYLWNMETLKAHLLEFTPEAGLIAIDFLVRHGLITAESERDYLDIVLNLRSNFNGIAGVSYHE